MLLALTQRGVELGPATAGGLGHAQERPAPALQHLDGRDVERLAGGDHPADQHVDPRRQLLEVDVFAQHAEGPLRIAHGDDERGHHQRDVDDLAVVGHDGDVGALVEHQLVQRVEERFRAGSANTDMSSDSNSGNAALL